MKRLFLVLLLLVCAGLRADNPALELAAKSGMAWAQYKLGNCYYSGGDDYPIDYEKAAIWYEKAAMNGHDKGQLAIGIAYRRGQGVVQNIPLGVSWMRKAAAQGHGLAMYNLSIVYSEVYRDLTEAYAWALVGRANGRDDEHRLYCRHRLDELDQKISRSEATAAKYRAQAIESSLGLK
jgi:TPR repeat protein